jgi:hypothetical protein
MVRTKKSTIAVSNKEQKVKKKNSSWSLSNESTLDKTLNRR